MDCHLPNEYGGSPLWCRVSLFDYFLNVHDEDATESLVLSAVTGTGFTTQHIISLGDLSWPHPEPPTLGPITVLSQTGRDWSELFIQPTTGAKFSSKGSSSFISQISILQTLCPKQTSPLNIFPHSTPTPFSCSSLPLMFVLSSWSCPMHLLNLLQTMPLLTCSLHSLALPVSSTVLYCFGYCY